MNRRLSNRSGKACEVQDPDADARTKGESLRRSYKCRDKILSWSEEM